MAEPAETRSGKIAQRRAVIALVLFVLVAIAVFAVAPDDLYQWIKAFHVIAVIAWMAGMLYLPRLFVYHADAGVGTETSETFKVMERRLLRVIMNPAMVIAWALGVWLAWYGSHYLEVWFWIKFLAIVGMTAAHGSLAKGVRLFAEDRNERSARSWRLINEVPTILMFVAVIAVIVKPF